MGRESDTSSGRVNSPSEPIFLFSGSLGEFALPHTVSKVWKNKGVQAQVYPDFFGAASNVWNFVPLSLCDFSHGLRLIHPSKSYFLSASQPFSERKTL